MERSNRKFRWLRVTGASLLGLLLLSALLPNIGGIIADQPPNLNMWHCGPFLFFPGPFFGVVGTVTLFTACNIFGIVRRNVCEFIGWILLGIVFLIMFFA